MYSTLIAASDLVRHLRLPGWVVVDCRFDLARPESGREAYARSHIPGAVYAHLDEDLSDTPSATRGRHPLPDPNRLAAKLGAWGIDNTTQVIAYDAGNGAMAARLWWLLRWLGVESVAVLDGGFKAWTDAGLPTSSAAASLRSAHFIPRPRPELYVEVVKVAERALDDRWRILDARSPERYAGSVEPIDPVAGHVPGACNYPFTDSLTADGRFLPVPLLRERLEQALATTSPEHTIAMCGSGVTACHTLLALEAAGLKGAKLYAGSWSEWIRDPSRPIARGNAPFGSFDRG